MIRCYLSQDRVVGFGHQMVTAFTTPPHGASGPSDPAPRLYHGPLKPEFQDLKRLLESGWLVQLQALPGVAPARPVIWDADFLLGPRLPAGE